MSSAYVPPEIGVEFDMDTEQYCLTATNHGRTAIAGIRILRAEPWPRIQFRHDTQEAAEKDARELRAYLHECASGKRKEKENAPTRRGWWED